MQPPAHAYFPRSIRLDVQCTCIKSSHRRFLRCVTVQHCATSRDFRFYSAAKVLDGILKYTLMPVRAYSRPRIARRLATQLVEMLSILLSTGNFYVEDGSTDFDSLSSFKSELF